MTKRKPTRFELKDYSYDVVSYDGSISYLVKVSIDTTRILNTLENEVLPPLREHVDKYGTVYSDTGETSHYEKDRKATVKYIRFLKSLDRILEESNTFDAFIKALEEQLSVIEQVSSISKRNDLFIILEFESPIISIGMRASEAFYNEYAEKFDSFRYVKRNVKPSDASRKENIYTIQLRDRTCSAVDSIFVAHNFNYQYQVGRIPYKMPHALWSLLTRLHMEQSGALSLKSYEVAELMHSYELARIALSDESNACETIRHRNLNSTNYLSSDFPRLGEDLVALYESIFDCIKPIKYTTSKERSIAGVKGFG